MSKISEPKEGCFAATHPSTTWVEVPCAKVPDRPLIPRRAGGGLHAATVGGGGGSDISLASGGTFIGVTGSFPSVSGVTSEASNGVSNAYSLQLNTNTFTPPKRSDGTSICDSATDPSSCQGWEQFVYEGGGGGFIQYWLLNYRTDNTCPSGWRSGAPAVPGDCYRNAVNGVPAPAEAITDLANVTVRGANGSGYDILQVTVNDTVYMTSQATFLNMNTNVWTTAEFNVFGDSGGDEAIFNTGSTIVVQIESDGSTTTSVPTCDSASFTGETTNLNIVPNSCCPTARTIQFMESNATTTPVPQACPLNQAARSTVAWNGAPNPLTARSCFTESYGRVTNSACNSSQTWEMALPVDAGGAWNVTVNVTPGSGSVSCMAFAVDQTGTQTSNSGSPTPATESAGQNLTLLVPSLVGAGSLYVGCFLTKGASVNNVNWYQ
ncbi:MAG TPA: hypothetical protein VGI39_26750 [Polyangiaceae bacterium]|jgi:hypothetical protein